MVGVNKKVYIPSSMNDCSTKWAFSFCLEEKWNITIIEPKCNNDRHFAYWYVYIWHIIATARWKECTNIKLQIFSRSLVVCLTGHLLTNWLIIAAWFDVKSATSVWESYHGFRNITMPWNFLSINISCWWFMRFKNILKLTLSGT